MRIQIDLTPRHTISPYLFMQFAEPLGTADASVDAGWDYLNDCWHPKLADKIRELGPGMIRWGGCFASYYHWREAVGPREDRVPMLNLCWDGIYSNQVGTHEVAELCRQVGAEPLMVVNMESDGGYTGPIRSRVWIGWAQRRKQQPGYGMPTIRMMRCGFPME